jgi:hypothetical protein
VQISNNFINVNKRERYRIDGSRMAGFLVSFTSNHFDKPYLASRGIDVEGNALFECKLCLSVVLAEDVDQHCESIDHKARTLCAKNIHGSPFAFACVELRSRIDGLGSKIWRNEIKAKLHDSFLLGSLMGPSFDYKPEIKRAKELVGKYERMERVALLDLAVWKSMSIATFQPNSERQGYHEWLEWMRHGWKTAKSKTQRCNEIDIVITSVCPFLDSTISMM